MNYGEIKTQIAKFAQRTDLGNEIPQFVANAGERIGRRFGVMPAPLIADTDTNSVLTTHPTLYLYAGLREYAVFTHNVTAVQAYEQLFTIEADRMNITYQGPDWAACEPPVMRPYVEPENA